MSRTLCALTSALLLAGCALDGRRLETAADATCEEVLELRFVERRTGGLRIEQLEAEIERLQSDLAHAQQVIIAAESDLKGTHTRAAAVRALAEARTALEGATAKAPWKQAEAGRAGALLTEADEQLRARHHGAAILLASRARRISSAMLEEARAVSESSGVLRVGVARANLRDDPSLEGSILATLELGTPLFSERSDGPWVLVRTPDNQLGWIHLSLVEAM